MKSEMLTVGVIARLGEAIAAELQRVESKRTLR